MAVYSFNYVNRKRCVSVSDDDSDNGVVDANDGILSPIVSFNCLSTLDEMKYTHKPHKDLNDRLKFLKVVDRSLKLYAGRRLKTFSLGCCFLEDYPSHLKRWMQTIAQLDVEELDLSGDMKSFTFHFQLISGLCTLRVLHLSSCNIKPGSVGQFNSLLSLSLMSVKLVRNEMSDILLSCPNLQYLKLQGCELTMKTRISGPNLKLKALTVIYCTGLHELEISAANNLVRISIDSCIKVKLVLSSVPELEFLSLINHTTLTPYSFGDDVQWDLPKLTTLVLKATFPVARNEVPWVPPTFDMFGNTRLLYLVMERNLYNLEYFPQVDLLCTLASSCFDCMPSFGDISFDGRWVQQQ